MAERYQGLAPLRPGIFHEQAAGGTPVLRGIRCLDCDAIGFPVRTTCPRCTGEQVAEIALSPTGRVRSYTTVYPGRSESYVIASVQLAEGIRILARLEGPAAGEVRVNMPVRLVWRSLNVVGQHEPVMGFAFTAQPDVN